MYFSSNLQILGHQRKYCFLFIVRNLGRYFFGRSVYYNLHRPTTDNYDERYNRTLQNS